MGTRSRQTLRNLRATDARSTSATCKPRPIRGRQQIAGLRGAAHRDCPKRPGSGGTVGSDLPP